MGGSPGGGLKVTDVYLSGLGVFQPPAVDAGQAARRGEYDPATYLENRFTAVCVAGDVSPPEMAAHAARQALSRVGADPARDRHGAARDLLFPGPRWAVFPGLHPEGGRR